MFAAAGSGQNWSSGLTVLATVVVVVGALALAWAISRTQALSAWRAAAEGYKEQALEVTGRLAHAEFQLAELTAEVARLTARPDMSHVARQLDEILEVCGGLRGALDDLIARRG